MDAAEAHSLTVLGLIGSLLTVLGLWPEYGSLTADLPELATVLLLLLITTTFIVVALCVCKRKKKPTVPE